MDDRVKINNFPEIKVESYQHFKNLYTKDKVLVQEVESYLQHVPMLLVKEDNDILRKKIVEEEVVQAIWDLDPDKALGPDGFSFHFFQAC